MGDPSLTLHLTPPNHLRILPPSLAPLLLCPSPISQEGHTALMIAVKEGKDKCVKLLLEAGCDKEAKDNVRDECGVVIMSREIVVLSCDE